jgi:hypothetical protein
MPNPHRPNAPNFSELNSVLGEVKKATTDTNWLTETELAMSLIIFLRAAFGRADLAERRLARVGCGLQRRSGNPEIIAVSLTKNGLQTESHFPGIQPACRRYKAPEFSPRRPIDIGDITITGPNSIKPDDAPVTRLSRPKVNPEFHRKTVAEIAFAIGVISLYGQLGPYYENPRTGSAMARQVLAGHVIHGDKTFFGDDFETLAKSQSQSATSNISQ